MEDNPLISIIVPCKEFNNYVEECIQHCENQNYRNYEIILLPDNPMDKIEGIEIIPTGPVSPGKKRNIGMRYANGELCAFIDSDAYPRRDWLENAVKYFPEHQIAAIGGPGVTPAIDSFMQRASGYILSSFMVGGLSSRYKRKKAKESADIHSCNFIARKSMVEKVTWNETYWPGEDTLMCLGIKQLGGKMLEAPDVVIYHHRRPLFLPHLKQVSRFGLHRGFFAKRFPENSFKLTYFFPSFLVLFLIFGSMSYYFIPSFRTIFVSLLSIYLILTLIAALLSKNVKLIFPVWAGIILTHLTYGTYFLTGLLKRELKR